MTSWNKQLIEHLKNWINDLSEELENENDVMFLHLDVNTLNGETITNIRVSNHDRKLQRPKQKTA